MKLRKLGVLAACGVLAASLALFGCSSNAASDKKADSASSDAAKADYTLVKEGKLTFGVSPDFPPFENLVDGQAEGFDIDLSKAIAEELGLEAEFVTLQFDGIMPAVAGGTQVDLGISGITIDPERSKQVDFTDSYYIDDQAIAVMKGGAVTSDNVLEELNKEGVVIAVQSGTTGETYCNENFPNATIQPYGNSTDAFAAMQAGQANAVCTNSAVVKKMLADAYTDAEIVKQIATGEEYAIAVSKDNSALKDAVNAAIKKLTDDGTVEQLTTKWLG